MWLVSVVFLVIRVDCAPSCCVAQAKQCTKRSFVKVMLWCAGEAVYQNGLCAGEAVYQTGLCEGPVVLCRWSGVPKWPLWRSWKRRSSSSKPWPTTGPHGQSAVHVLCTAFLLCTASLFFWQCWCVGWVSGWTHFQVRLLVVWWGWVGHIHSLV